MPRGTESNRGDCLAQNKQSWQTGSTSAYAYNGRIRSSEAIPDKSMSLQTFPEAPVWCPEPQVENHCSVLIRKNGCRAKWRLLQPAWSLMLVWSLTLSLSHIRRAFVTVVTYRFSPIHGLHPQSAVLFWQSLHGDHSRPSCTHKHTHTLSKFKISKMPNRNKWWHIIIWEYFTDALFKS